MCETVIPENIDTVIAKLLRSTGDEGDEALFVCSVIFNRVFTKDTMPRRFNVGGSSLGNDSG
jgi:hypothetical protein